MSQGGTLTPPNNHPSTTVEGKLHVRSSEESERGLREPSLLFSTGGWMGKQQSFLGCNLAIGFFSRFLYAFINHLTRSRLQWWHSNCTRQHMDNLPLTPQIDLLPPPAACNYTICLSGPSAGHVMGVNLPRNATQIIAHKNATFKSHRMGKGIDQMEW